MKPARYLTIGVFALVALSLVLAYRAVPVQAAYHHQGEIDSANFLAVCPEKAGTKLDSCSLCHTGGEKKGKPVGSCQWCHDTFGYDGHGNIVETLNPYGKDYLSHGRSADAIREIVDLDSDGDGHINSVEIAATRYPGDAKDDPSKVPAPHRVYSRAELEAMPQHTQLLLMNASKSDDFYSQYRGVAMETLIDELATSSATGITVFSPDGFAQYHPMNAEDRFYQVKGTYPDGIYYYNKQADMAKNPEGWVNYSSPAVAGMTNGDAITNPDGLKLLLAIKRDGQDLVPGVLNTQNKLDGEGPFRVVPPQLVPCPPDQRSSASNQNVVWPYKDEVDHNAGFSTRSTTIIRVEPLPAGTTDIDITEAGWGYIDADKIVVYGNINPIPTVQTGLDGLIATVSALDDGAFKNRNDKTTLIADIEKVKEQVANQKSNQAITGLQHIMGRLDGCTQPGTDNRSDWISSCDVQKSLYWSVNDIVVLLQMKG